MYALQLWTVLRVRMWRRLMLSALIVAISTLGFRVPAARAVEAVIATIPVGNLAAGVGVNATTNRIYVANYGSGTVSVIDSLTNTSVAMIAVGDGPTDVGVNTSTNRIYVVVRFANAVLVVDGFTNTTIATIGVGDLPSGVAVNAITNRIYVANTDSNTVSVIDGVTNTVVDSVDVGSYPFGVGVNATTNRIYVADWDENGTVSVIDGLTNSVIATVSVGNHPLNVAVNISTNHIYVTNESPGSNGTVSVIDGFTNTVLGTIAVGSYPTDVGVNASTNRIYVADFGSNNVSVIDGLTNSVIAIVNVGTDPDGVGVNATTNRIYVANAVSNTASVIADEPTTALTVRYMAGDISPQARLVRPYFKIANTGNLPVPLSELTVRYWYTADGNTYQFGCCIYADFGCGNMIRSFHKLDTPRQGADYYMELGFKPQAGNVEPHRTTGAIINWFFNWPFNLYDQTNDYSFDASRTSYADYTRITLYRNGVLIWGTEPGPLLSAQPAAQTTPAPTFVPKR